MSLFPKNYDVYKLSQSHINQWLFWKVSGKFDVLFSWTHTVAYLSTRCPMFHLHLYTIWRLCWTWSRSPPYMIYILDNHDDIYWLACYKMSFSGHPKPFSVHVCNHLVKDWEPTLIFVMVIDRFHKYHKKCPWLYPNGQDPHFKPHIILIIIMLCID